MALQASASRDPPESFDGRVPGQAPERGGRLRQQGRAVPGHVECPPGPAGLHPCAHRCPEFPHRSAGSDAARATRRLPLRGGERRIGCRSACGNRPSALLPDGPCRGRRRADPGPPRGSQITQSRLGWGHGRHTGIPRPMRYRRGGGPGPWASASPSRRPGQWPPSAGLPHRTMPNPRNPWKTVLEAHLRPYGDDGAPEGDEGDRLP